MTLEEILNLSWDDINSMSKEDLKKMYKVLRKNTTRRMKSLEKVYEEENLPYSPALKKLMDLGGYKLGRNSINNRNLLLEYNKRMMRFLEKRENSTATIKGLRRYVANIEKITGVNYKEWSEERRKTFWSYIDRYRDIYGRSGILAVGYESGRTINAVAQIYNNSNKLNNLNNLEDTEFANTLEELVLDYTQQLEQELDDEHFY